MIKLVLAVTPALYRQILQERIDSEGDILVVRHATAYSDVLSITNEHGYDLIFLDSNLAGLNLMEYLRFLKEKRENQRILLLMKSGDRDQVVNALCLGIKGCLYPECGPDTFIRAVRAVASDELWADVGLISKALGKMLQTRKFSIEDLKHKLTKKEENIARLILHGCSNKQIARQLFISEKTVKTHIGHIFKKLGIRSRFQLTASYLDNEVIQTES